MMIALRLLLILALLIPPMPVYADPPGPPEKPPEGGTCDLQGFKDALSGRESSGDCSARRPGSQFLGKYQLGKKNALADIKWTDKDGNWINGMNDQMYLSSCEIQEKAMNEWIAVMAGNIKAAQTGDGRMLTSFIGQPIPACPSKNLTFSGLLGGRHLCGIGWTAARATSGKCYQKGFTGLIAYFESGGAKDGQDGLGTRISEYICKFNGYQTPYETGGDFSSCGGGMEYGGSPGGGKKGFDPGGYYGDTWNENPEIRHYNMIRDLIIRIWLGGLALMTNQMVATMMNQAEIVGAFFDAKHQLETQRLLQRKTARAHKDYHPSEQMCTIGTFARNLLNSDRRMQFYKATLSQRAMQRELMNGENLAVESHVSDRQSRFQTFREKFCNPKDNAGTLNLVCEGDPDPAMMNRDIDFTRTLDQPLTLKLDPLEPTASDDETAVQALMDNLFYADPTPAISKEITTLENFGDVYQDLRAIVALRAIARDTMNNIIAQKSLGPKTEKGEGSSAPFLRALIRDLGITDEEEITALLGERPSYYAQMEILTKKIYQDPQFVINLYDKPANVARVRAAMRAIKTMQDRDIHEALMRREMLISILAELSVREQQERIDILIRRLSSTPRQ